MVLVLFVSKESSTVSAAVRYMVGEEEPLVWCDEDYPILDVNDPVEPNFANDVDDEYY